MIELPRDTRIDTSVQARCYANDQEIRLFGDGACPGPPGVDVPPTGPVRRTAVVARTGTAVATRTARGVDVRVRGAAGCAFVARRRAGAATTVFHEWTAGGRSRTTAGGGVGSDASRQR